MKVYPKSYTYFMINEYENLLRKNNIPMNICKVCKFRFGCKKNNGPCDPIGMVYDYKKIEKILLKNKIISKKISITPISLRKLVNLWGSPIKYEKEFNMFSLRTWDAYFAKSGGGCNGMIEEEVVRQKDIPKESEWIIPTKFRKRTIISPSEIKKRKPITLQELATKYKTPIYYDADLESICLREFGIAYKNERGPGKAMLNNFYDLFKDLPKESGWFMP